MPCAKPVILASRIARDNRADGSREPVRKTCSRPRSRQMGMQADVEFLGKLSGGAHQRRRQKREHGASAICTMASRRADDVSSLRALSAGWCLVLPRRRAATRRRAASGHRAAGQQRACRAPAHRPRYRRRAPVRREYVMMICRGGAADSNSSTRYGDAELSAPASAAPCRVERLQWGTTRSQRRGRAGQRLIEMVVGVDQTWQYHMGAGPRRRH